MAGGSGKGIEAFLSTDIGKKRAHEGASDCDGSSSKKKGEGATSLLALCLTGVL